MRDLAYFRPSYELRGAEPGALDDAHRLTRTAAAVAMVIRVPDPILDPALAAIERVENSTDDERRLSTREVAALAAMIAAVDRALGEAIDDDQRLRGHGPVREAIEGEAARPTELDGAGTDHDRVFELLPDGRVGMLHPRMSLYELLAQLPEAAGFLTAAATRGDDVALVE